MAAHHDLIKRLSQDDELRAAVLAAPTRDAKHEAVRAAGLAVPDHHDVLQAVAGGNDLDGGDIAGIAVGSAAGGVLIGASVAAAALV
jgi:hypothetical protein